MHLHNSDVSFIRCIKPNDYLDPSKFDDAKVLAQLRSNAVLAACAISAAGFPDHLEFSEAVRMYRNALYHLEQTQAAMAQSQPKMDEVRAKQMEDVVLKVAERAEKFPHPDIMVHADHTLFHDFAEKHGSIKDLTKHADKARAHTRPHSRRRNPVARLSVNQPARPTVSP